MAAVLDSPVPCVLCIQYTKEIGDAQLDDGDPAAGFRDDRDGVQRRRQGCGPAGRGQGWATRPCRPDCDPGLRSEENKSELQSLMRISYAVFCLTKRNNQ